MVQLTNKEEKFIRSVKSVSATNVDLEKIDFSTVEKEEVFGNKKSIEDTFEELYANQLDLTKENPGGHGRYIDHKTETVWRAFKVALCGQERVLIRARSKIKRSSVLPPFIIGVEVADQTVQFGYRPFKHGSIEQAREEAEKLARRNELNYLIFGVVDRALSPVKTAPMPVSETKQKEKGRIKTSSYRVFDEIQDFIKNNNDYEPGRPVGFNFSATGKILVDLWMVEERMTFDTFEDLIKYLNNWIRKAKQKEGQTSSVDDSPADDTTFAFRETHRVRCSHQQLQD